MKKRMTLFYLSLVLLMTLATVVGCSSSEKETVAEKEETSKEEVVNLYTNRHYDTDEQLLNQFTEETGIKVNVVKGDSDELIERLKREGKDTKADVLITADAGRLSRAKDRDLLQSIKSETLDKNIPENLRDKDSTWFGLTVRGRVFVYPQNRVNPSELSTYNNLTDPKWEGKILVRSSASVYNQSLLASFIALNGEEKAREWAKGIVKNMARTPKGNDRAQATAVVAGEGDIAIMNTYYIGKMLTSSNPEEVEVAKKVGVFFPDQEGQGTHINVSGAGITKYSHNKENAIKLLEFLSGEKAQKLFSEANFEYPVNPHVEPSELLKSWGDFKTQNINLSKLGEYNSKAVEIFNEVGWK